MYKETWPSKWCLLGLKDLLESYRIRPGHEHCEKCRRAHRNCVPLCNSLIGGFPTGVLYLFTRDWTPYVLWSFLPGFTFFHRHGNSTSLLPNDDKMTRVGARKSIVER